jgi:predicted tellurium resistance membrane protein TerC
MELFSAENLVALLTLLSLEIVLGIDNVIFISILAGKVPEHQRDLGRQLGIGLAVISRIILLLAISWVQSLEGTELFSIFGNDISGKDMVLLLGGMFLIGKSTYEIHEKLDVADDHGHAVKAGTATLSSMIAQVLLIDVVFRSIR